MQTQKKHRLQQLRHWRVRSKVTGTTERPRMSVCFTGAHIYVQFIDDTAGKTSSRLPPGTRRLKGQKVGANVATAKNIGGSAAEGGD